MGNRKRVTGDLKVVDLFSGVGGLSLGAARAGFVVCGAVDKDPQAMAAHRLNFPRTVHLETDVAQLTGKALKGALGVSGRELAGVIGGPPCQGFSCIGRNDAKDPRNGLFVHFFRIVKETQPKFFLAENVPGILNEKNAPIREAAFDCVRGDYTILPPMKIAANDYGAPTSRTRVFFFGYKQDEIRPLTHEDFKPPADVHKVVVGAALAGLPARVLPRWQTEDQSWRVVEEPGEGPFADRLHGHIPDGVGNPAAIERLNENSEVSGFLGTFHSIKVATRYGRMKRGMRDEVSKSRRLDPDGFCPTLRAGTGADRGSFQAVRPIHPTVNRVITPREAARLQGFPDWFQFSPTKWHSFRQIGNSVSPIVAERILAVIRNALVTGAVLKEVRR